MNDEPLARAAAWLDEGERVALATVVETWGSAPCPAGSQMALTASGRMAGSVSGGCVEGAVADAAMALIEGGPPRLLEFGVTDERAWEVGLACGGTVRVLVERASPASVRTLLAARAAHRPVALATCLKGFAQVLLPDTAADPALAAAAAQALAEDRSRIAQIAGADWFLHAYNPPLRVIAVGAVHIAQALARVLAPLGLHLVVIDPRRGFASEERFPDATLHLEWPETALDTLAPDSRTAVIVLSHDPKLDDPALDRALRSPAFYIGALGSRKNHARRLERLAALGHTPEALARIRGPVGLRIGALTPAEVALSIAAEIVAVRRGGACAGP